MIKNYGARKLSRTSAHRRSLLRNLATSLFLHEKIETTHTKAKELSKYSQKLLTSAKPGDFNAKRAVFAEIKDEVVRKKIFDVLVPRYKDRAGGLTKIFIVGTRRGDAASVAIIKLLS